MIQFRRRLAVGPPPPLSPSLPTVASLLAACTSLRSLEQIHALIVRAGLEQDHHLSGRFLGLCASLSAPPAYAASALARVANPSLPLWNAVIAAHCRRGHDEALRSFRSLRRGSDLSPDSFSFAPIIKSCSGASDLRSGTSFHSLALRLGIDSDVFVRTSLVDMYGKLGDIGAAQRLFDTMPHRNEVSWTAMLVGFLSGGDLGSARELFDEMPVRNAASWNAMIDGYVKSGDLVAARKLFDEMPERNEISFTCLIDGYAKAGDMASARALFEVSEGRDIFSWSAMISGYVQIGFPVEAWDVFVEFYRRGMKPDEYIVVGAISACSQLSNLSYAEWMDWYIDRNSNSIDVSKQHVMAALIDMHAKCGNMERATILFNSLPKRDLVSYCSMMQGYSLHGLANKAVELFSQMLGEGLVPDSVAFNVILTACSHSGLVSEGKRYFEMMENEYMISPSRDHYACMVDLLSRAERLKEAYDVICLMPGEPHPGSWGALLGACRRFGYVEVGEVVARKLFEVEPLNGSNYVLLSNIYAAEDRWADVTAVRDKMSVGGVKKVPGRTWL